MSADVVVVGAGPAGAVAAVLLARAGLRVRLLDRARFPREKLCGDTINPGTMRLLDRLQLVDAAAGGLPIEGMRVSIGHASVEARYPEAERGRALRRRDFDAALVAHAIRAGARFEPATTATGLVVDGRSGRAVVTGIDAVVRGRALRIDAPVVIVADGRRSRLAAPFGGTPRPAVPRRWAFGAYVEGVTALGRVGEMHVRAGHYIGIAPLGDGAANVSVVVDASALRRHSRSPSELMRQVIQQDEQLRDRSVAARLVTRPLVLGPLAVDVTPPSVDGLLLAGDAAGFVDPMTGDGMRFAVAGGEMCAMAAQCALRDGWRAARALEQAHRGTWAAKQRFNRALRRLTASALAVAVGGRAVALAPSLIRPLVAHAGDCAC